MEDHQGRFTNLLYFQIHGELPRDAGLTYKEAISYELKEYWKVMNAYIDECNEAGKYTSVDKIQEIDAKLAMNIIRLADLYGYLGQIGGRYEVPQEAGSC